MSPSSPYAVVVNDDSTQLSLLSGLVRKAGLAPRSFTKAETALTEMSSGTDAPPALIVTDLYMPGIDGWQFCRLLRSPEYAALNHVPILVVSATFSGDHASHIAADLGAEAVLPSPVDGKRFCEQVRAILSGEQVRHPLRVLVVEDNVDLCALLKDVFANHGYQAETVFTVQAAVEAFGKTAYDVAVLDHHLPDGMGDGLLVEFRAMRPDCVCLMVTGDTGPELALDWMKKGAAAYLLKPFKPDYLIELCARARRERALLRVQYQLEMRTRELLQSKDAALKSVILRLEVEQQVRQLSNQQRVILDTTPVAIFHLKDRKVQWANPAFGRILGYTDEESIGFDTASFYASREEYERVGSAGYEQLAKGEIYSAEVEVKRKDASVFWASIVGKCVDIQNPAEGSIWTLYDTTERKHILEALQASEIRQHSILTAMSEGVVVQAADGTITDCNLNAEMILGLNRNEIMGLTSVDSRWQAMCADGSAFPGEDHPAMVSLRTGRACHDVLMALHLPDGSSKWININAEPMIRQGETRPYAVVTSFADITERKRVEEAKEKLELQNQQLQKSESLGRMAGAIAHHFNNQLQVVMMNLQMAIDELPKNVGPVANLAEAMLSARKAAKVSIQMLTYLGQTTAKGEPLDLSDACQRHLPMLRAVMPQNVVLETDLPSPGPAINANTNQIQQILTNLLTNACEAMGEAPGVIRLTVKTVPSADIPAVNRFPIDFHLQGVAYACLKMGDSACGIDAENIDKLFDPFFSTKFTGRGLGLSVVLGIVRAHEGCVTVESQPGKGSVFSVFLPLSAEAIPQKPVPVAQNPKAAGVGTVLVVDDELTLRKVVATALTRSGFTVLAAADGVEALEVFEQHRDEIRCVLCDLTMPRMNGWDTLTALRKLAPGIPVILASGYSEAQVMTGDHPELPQAFLSKPYELPTLREVIARVMKNPKELR